MKLIFLCGLLTLAKAQHICCNQGTTIATAVSLIKPNSKPPPGIKTQVVGTIKMKQNYGQPTSIFVQLSGLPPNTQHGFHIHEYGDTVTNGCQSTGAHYNPFNYTHGGPNDQIRHAGDLGNLYSNAKGQINHEILQNFVCLCGPYSVFGRAFVVHQRMDDLGRGTGPAQAESLRTGNAGARLGCGVIFHGTFQKPIIFKK